MRMLTYLRVHGTSPGRFLQTMPSGGQGNNPAAQSRPRTTPRRQGRAFSQAPSLVLNASPEKTGAEGAGKRRTGRGGVAAGHAETTAPSFI